MEITVLGAGSWGATLATLLFENRNNVILWEFDSIRSKKITGQKNKTF